MRTITTAKSRKACKGLIMTAMGLTFVGGLLVENRTHVLHHLFSTGPGLLASVKVQLYKYLHPVVKALFLGTIGWRRTPTKGARLRSNAGVRGP